MMRKNLSFRPLVEALEAKLAPAGGMDIVVMTTDSNAQSSFTYTSNTTVDARGTEITASSSASTVDATTTQIVDSTFADGSTSYIVTATSDHNQEAASDKMYVYADGTMNGSGSFTTYATSFLSEEGTYYNADGSFGYWSFSQFLTAEGSGTSRFTLAADGTLAQAYTYRETRNSSYVEDRLDVSSDGSLTSSHRFGYETVRFNVTHMDTDSARGHTYSLSSNSRVSSQNFGEGYYIFADGSSGDWNDSMSRTSMLIISERQWTSGADWSGSLSSSEILTVNSTFNATDYTAGGDVLHTSYVGQQVDGTSNAFSSSGIGGSYTQRDSHEFRSMYNSTVSVDEQYVDGGFYGSVTTTTVNLRDTNVYTNVNGIERTHDSSFRRETSSQEEVFGAPTTALTAVFAGDEFTPLAAQSALVGGDDAAFAFASMGFAPTDVGSTSGSSASAGGSGVSSSSGSATRLSTPARRPGLSGSSGSRSAKPKSNVLVSPLEVSVLPSPI